VRVKYDLSPSWQLRVAAFNVDPESNGNSSRAWHLGPKHTTGTVVPIELVYKLQGELPGEYKLGYYYDSSDVKRIGSDEKCPARRPLPADRPGGVERPAPQAAACTPSASTRRKRGRFAVHQVVWRRRGAVQTVRRPPEGHRGPGLRPGRANPRSRDVLEGRVQRRARTSHIDSAEQLIELSYGYQATPWLNLRPDAIHHRAGGVFRAKTSTTHWWWACRSRRPSDPPPHCGPIHRRNPQACLR
jgi:porin